MKINEIAEQAKIWAEQQYPDESGERHAAFANCVVSARMPVAGPFGGPSIRQLVAENQLRTQGYYMTTIPEDMLFLWWPIWSLVL